VIRLLARSEPGLAGSEESAERLLQPPNASTGSHAGTPIRMMPEQNGESTVSRHYMPVEKLTTICNAPGAPMITAR